MRRHHPWRILLDQFAGLVFDKLLAGEQFTV